MTFEMLSDKSPGFTEVFEYSSLRAAATAAKFFVQNLGPNFGHNFEQDLGQRLGHDLRQHRLWKIDTEHGRSTVWPCA